MNFKTNVRLLIGAVGTFSDNINRQSHRLRMIQLYLLGEFSSKVGFTLGQCLQHLGRSVNITQVRS